MAMISLFKNFNFLKICSSSASNCCNACVNFSSISKIIKPDTFERASATTSPLLQTSASYSSQFKARDRKELLKTVGQLDEGVQEESVVSLDAIISRWVLLLISSCMFICFIMSDSSLYVLVLMVILTITAEMICSLMKKRRTCCLEAFHFEKYLSLIWKLPKITQRPHWPIIKVNLYEC